MAKISNSPRQPSLQEALLQIMDRKDHWAWPHIQKGRATREQLLVHFQQEYRVFIRDFPVLLSRVHSRCPIPGIRRELAENIFEEETGKLTRGEPHPELFLQMMEGFGFDRADFRRIALIPEADAYRAWIDQVTRNRPWIEAAVLVTIFIEGSVQDRAHLEKEASPYRVEPEQEVRNTPWFLHYGIEPRYLNLKRVHQMVEGDHRESAWHAVLDQVTTPRTTQRVVEVMQRSLDLWQRYRDGVARAAGIPRGVSARSA